MEKENTSIYVKIMYGLIAIILLIVIIGMIVKVVKNEKIENPKVTFTLEGKGDIVIELYPKKAPNTVNNFINLVNSGWYNGKIVYGKDFNTIHIGRNKEGADESPRLSLVNPDIQKGSDKDVAYEIDGEFADNGFANDLRHEKYMISMARKNYTGIIKELEKESYNSASAAFNIVMGDKTPELDGKYAVFGKVIKGQEICDEIFKSDTNVPENDENRWQLRRFPKDKRYVIKEATCTDRKKKKVKTHERFDFNKYILDRFKEETKRQQEEKASGKKSDDSKNTQIKKPKVEKPKVEKSKVLNN